MIDLRKIIGLFYFPLGVLVLHLIISPFNLYILYPWIDIPMHFLGGFSVTFVFSRTIAHLIENKLIKMHGLISFIFVLSLVSLTAVSWEFLEFLVSNLLSINLQPGLEDTLLDLLMGLSGGILGFFVFYPNARL